MTTKPTTTTRISLKSGKKPVEEAPNPVRHRGLNRRRKQQPSVVTRIRRKCAVIADNKFFVAIGTVLTIWALMGDDLKMLLTEKPADSVFDGLVIVNLVFFTAEVVISSLGKDDYVVSFFFWLDIISTATLLLDLSAVAEGLFGQSDDISKARSSKTARVGAKMGRVVRVIRLLRIVKLFKAFSAAKKEQKPPETKKILDGEFSDEDDETDEEQVNKESVVGKKLSDKMTQRTIIVVLSMLVIVPLLAVEESDKMPSSGQFGADLVLERFRQFQINPHSQENYEKSVLKMMYYHNWFTAHAGTCPHKSTSCPGDFHEDLFWVGIGGKEVNAQVLESVARNASLTLSEVQSWNQAVQNQNLRFNFGTMPEQAVTQLGSSWNTRCSDKSGNKLIGVSLLGQMIPDIVPSVVQCATDLRFNEASVVFPSLITETERDQWFFVFYSDRRRLTKLEAGMSLLTTVFICVILCVASIFFSSTANVLVLGPVEKMIRKVEAIRDNPLVAMQMADDEFKREEIAKNHKKKQSEKRCRDPRTLCRESESELNETVILEKTIIKLGSLLALGFGEAGANIVSSTMMNSSVGVNVMVQGSRVDCIIGIARILNFSTATEVLQGKVMTFVNQIAEIVHGEVDECQGAVNKNDGSTFVIIWRVNGMDWVEKGKMAEMSIFAFARCMASIGKSPLLATYQTHPGLQQRLGKDCRVELSFGLHCGWAIEGAVGSEFKIDASYISPNVSIGASVAQATHVYGVNILVSQAVTEWCSKKMMGLLRKIDKVIIKGSKDPLELYSLDLNSRVIQAVELRQLPITWNSYYRFASRQFNESAKNRLWTAQNSVVDILKSDSDFENMRKEITNKFMHTFSMGYQNYSQGEWKVARNLLERTRTMLSREDGPSAALLRFMESANNFEAPASWVGVHPLEENPSAHL